MKTFTTFLQKTFSRTEGVSDPVRDFFVKGNTKDKRVLYEQALRGAQADQEKVLAEYSARAL